MDILSLQDKLDELSSWRKNELLQAYFLAENAQTQEAQRYLCRAWVLLMYAHCENFLKQAAQAYLSFLQSSQNKGYQPELMWLILHGNEVLIKGNDKYKSFNDFKMTENTLHFTTINKVFSKKSFQYRSLQFICDWVMQIEFDHQIFSAFTEELKRKRDSIAHGEQSYVEVADDCKPWHENTIRFIDTLKESLMTSAMNHR